MSKPRIWLSNRKPAKGEVVIVRAMVAHPMETGLRKQASGELVPRNIINSFTCTLDGATLFSWRPETAVSPSPYLEFRFLAETGGELAMRWTDDAGQTILAQERIEIAA